MERGAYGHDGSSPHLANIKHNLLAIPKFVVEKHGIGAHDIGL
jgi:hypothetical protein